MAFKFVVLAALAATLASIEARPELLQAHHISSIGHIGHIGLQSGHIGLQSGHYSNLHEIEHHSHPKYNFHYSVHDLHTGDIKSQHESRDGDVVHGSYSLVEPDGSRRTVDYTADKHSGFNAVVRREHAHAHIQPIHHAPALALHATPIIETSHHLGHQQLLHSHY